MPNIINTTKDSFYRPQRSWGKAIFSEACVKNSVHRGGSCVLADRGGMCACWEGGVCGCWGACVVAGGMHGCQGVCMVAWGVCMVAGERTWLLGACVVARGHAWLLGACLVAWGVMRGEGGMCGEGGCVVKKGVCGEGGMHGI